MSDTRCSSFESKLVVSINSNEINTLYDFLSLIFLLWLIDNISLYPSYSDWFNNIILLCLNTAKGQINIFKLWKNLFCYMNIVFIVWQDYTHL